MVTAGIGTPYHGTIVQAISNELYEHSYSAIFSFSGSNIHRERESMRMLKERQVDGLIVSLLTNDHGEFENADLVQILRSQGTPVVLMDSYFRDSRTDFVINDLSGGVRKAMNHLASLGHTRIGYLCSGLYRRRSDGRLSGDDRLEGYKSGLADAGIPFDESLVVAIGPTIDGGYRGAKLLLEAKPKPTAIFCYTDLLAVGALRAMHDAEVRVPEEMSIIGCDDSDLAQRAEVPLRLSGWQRKRWGGSLRRY
jgi:DNA-binding LacI/PurR family transcriptional regulator